MRVCKIIHIFCSYVNNLYTNWARWSQMHGMPLVWYENRESIAFYNRTLQRARDQSHKLCLFGIGKWALRKKKAADFFKKLVDKLPRAIRNLQKKFLSRSSFGLEATSEVLDDPSLFHPTLCYATPYHRQTDRQTDIHHAELCRNISCLAEFRQNWVKPETDSIFGNTAILW